MRVHVAFTPAEEVSAPVGIVIDVLRATSTICQALAGGRFCVKIDGFDFGNSPREFADRAPKGDTLVLTTTNGTRLLLAAAARCETVLVGSLLNLAAVVEEARASGADDVAVLCAGVKGELALDDAYCAGRIAEALGGEPADSAAAAIRLAHTFASHEEGLASSKSASNLRNAGLEADIAWCAQESMLDVVPRVVARRGASVQVALSAAAASLR